MPARALVAVFVLGVALLPGPRAGLAAPERPPMMPFDPPLKWKMDPAVYRQDFTKTDTWKAVTGRLDWRADAMLLPAEPASKALFVAFPHHRPGGSAAYLLRLRFGDPARGAFKIAVNVFDHTVNVLGGRPRFPDQMRLGAEDSLAWTPEGGAVARLQDQAGPIAWRPEPGREYDIRFVCVDRFKALFINGERIAAAWVQTPWVGVEGDLTLESSGLELTLSGLEVRQTGWDLPARRYERGELLDADDFTDPAATERGWVYELKDAGEAVRKPLLRDGWLRAEPYSAVWRRRAGDGPVIYTFDCRPVPKDPARPETITDAIFFFQASWYNLPFDFFIRKHYDERHSVYGDLQGYWLDWGGNGNRTTRLRKLPYRQLLLQSIAPEDQLKPGRIHAVEMLCADSELRFSADGRVILQCFDLTPYRSGHFGMLGFVRATEIRNFKVYRARLVE